MNFTVNHIPVLLKEVLYYLNLKQDNIFFDGTLGGAGHTVEIIKAIAPTGKVIGVDLHSQTISTAATKLKKFSRNLFLVNDNFANIVNILKKLNFNHIDGILLDLGLSSFLIERSERGFSYLKNEKLDMRFGNNEGLSAFEIINEYAVKELEEIFYKYGEERYSASIARNIAANRKTKKIDSTGRLVEIIKNSVPGIYRSGKWGHPAKRIFQAVRIEVNSELENLKRAISDGLSVLNKGGRMVIISYHSLEDRIVKNKYKQLSGICACPPDFPVCKCGVEKKAEIITRKAVRPGPSEIKSNPRAKSAKLRALAKV